MYYGDEHFDEISSPFSIKEDEYIQKMIDKKIKMEMERNWEHSKTEKSSSPDYIGYGICIAISLFISFCFFVSRGDFEDFKKDMDEIQIGCIEELMRDFEKQFYQNSKGEHSSYDPIIYYKYCIEEAKFVPESYTY